jgi:hypothetical protein
MYALHLGHQCGKLAAVPQSMGVFDFLALGGSNGGLAVASHGQILLSNISCLIHMY